MVEGVEETGEVVPHLHNNPKVITANKGRVVLRDVLRAARLERQDLALDLLGLGGVVVERHLCGKDEAEEECVAEEVASAE